MKRATGIPIFVCRQPPRMASSAGTARLCAIIITHADSSILNHSRPGMSIKK
jgi:hypothetical protein